MQTSITPAAGRVLEERGGMLQLAALLARHHAGDWGDLPPEDRKANVAALEHGSRILSVYKLDGETIWIITDGVTTACERCWTGSGECPGMEVGTVEGGVHFLPVEERRITTTVLLPEDY